MTQEELEQALAHERAKARWLCGMLAKTNDGSYHSLETGKTAEQWVMLAELAMEMDRQRGDAWKK